MGLTQEDVSARLQLQGVAGSLETTLETEVPDAFGGLWLDQGKQFRVVVGLTQGGMETIDPYIKGSALEGTIDLVPSKYLLSDLRLWAQEFLFAAFDRVGSIEGKFDLAVDIPQNRIEVRASDDNWVSQSSDLAKTLEDVDPAAFSFEVGELAQQQTDIWAGYTFTQGVGGYCTVGFSTRTTTGGQSGVTTAAHCANTCRLSVPLSRSRRATCKEIKMFNGTPYRLGSPRSLGHLIIRDGELSPVH